MCGICGIVTSKENDNSHTLRKMNDELLHRGPDDSGYYETESNNYYIGLGHRRLSIIDLSTGHQPISNEDGNIQIVFNGEIYNFHELRKDLIEKGHIFSTNSDTETILHAYEEYGESCVELLRGMFAIAIWDNNSKKLFLARDRFGVKPLFYYYKNETFVFASEIKSLLKFPDLQASLREESLPEYLFYRYMPAPFTMFNDIKKFMPGTIALWSDGNLVESRYYTPYDSNIKNKKVIPEKPVEKFLSLLDESVEIRMISDVPFGAFLSGGLDSSSIVALMSKHSSLPVKTFTIAFSEDAYSEESYADLISKKFKTEHSVLTVTPDHLMDELPKLIRFRDAPVSEPADIPIYMLSKYAAQSVKMVLSGEGSDEMLGGYPKHAYESLGTFYRYIPELLRHGMIEPLIKSLPYRFYRWKTAIINLGINDQDERFVRWFGSLTKKEVSQLLGIQSINWNENQIQFSSNNLNSPLRKLLFFDQTSWLPDNLLERGDRMTMAASIEARMPFMDHKLSEYVSSLPDSYRVKGMKSKWILKEAMRDILPNSIIDRPKVGFRVPVNEWFKGPMKDFLYEHLTGTNSLTEKFYSRNKVFGLLDEHTRGRQNHEKILWCLLNLEMWCREYKVL